MSKELKQKRAEVITSMRVILDRADEETRDLTAEETGQYETLETELDGLDEKIEQFQKAEARRTKLAAAEASLAELPRVGRTQLEPNQLNREEQEMAAFRTYLQSGGRNISEMAALQMDSDTGGGSMVIPEQFVAQLIDGLDEALHIRSLATIFPVTSAASLGAPSLEADPADADWTVELASGDLDTTMATGKRMLTPRSVAKRLKVSKTLLRQSAIPVDALVRNRLQFKMAVTQEKAFMTGVGATGPLGVFTASADGIPTAQDESTDNTTTAITGDGLINCKYKLKAQYHMSPNLRWIFHRDALKMIRKLKDGNGQYLWQPGLAGDRAPTIVDVPYLVSEYAPNTFTTGLYVGIIGDFSYYWIAEAMNMTIQVLMELYAATNEDGYHIRAELDGMPVLSEAFARVTLA